MDGDTLLRQRSVASIPSKFETVLHDGPRERDAFWCRTHRFQYQENEMPGPGTYKARTDLENKGLKPSFSKKGYTGMASKSNRFFMVRKSFAPPPGTYNPESGYKALQERRECSVATSTSMFAKPIVAPDYVKGRRGAQVVAPGPGQYDVTSTKEPRAKGKAAPFLTTSDRFAGQGVGAEEELGPAPGSYDYESINRQTGALKLLQSRAPSSAFNSKTGRMFGPPDKEEDVVSALKPHPSLGPSLGIQVDIKAKGRNETKPGPGQYEPHLSDQILTLDKIRHSSMFSRTNLDRFGVPLQKKTDAFAVPGPGAYPLADKARKERAEASGSAFVSTSERSNANVVGVAPGPAYYNPSLPHKKSFHLNANKRWI